MGRLSSTKLTRLSEREWSFEDGEYLFREFLIHDRDCKSRATSRKFSSSGSKGHQTPVRSPTSNAFAERWVLTARSECLDWILVRGQRHLECVLRTSIDHYNRARPHRALGLELPEPTALVVDSNHGYIGALAAPPVRRDPGRAQVAGSRVIEPAC